MLVKRFAEAKGYEAPNHRAYASLRLFGAEAGGPKQFLVGLSHFLPGGGARGSASPTEKVYVVLVGELTVIVGGKETVLEANNWSVRAWASSGPMPRTSPEARYRRMARTDSGRSRSHSATARRGPCRLVSSQWPVSRSVSPGRTPANSTPAAANPLVAGSAPRTGTARSTVNPSSRMKWMYSTTHASSVVTSVRSATGAGTESTAMPCTLLPSTDSDSAQIHSFG